MLVRPFGFSLGVVYGAIRVLGRRVQRVQLQRLLPGVPDVVPGTRRNDDGIVSGAIASGGASLRLTAWESSAPS
jgi:hypothetical protein